MRAHRIEPGQGLIDENKPWGGGDSPFKISYGKVMMWYFLISDTFIFASFLIAYAAARFAQGEAWPVPSQVFDKIPIHGLDHHWMPLVFVSIMTFILILSSVTMVRAVQEGFQMNKWGVVKYLIPTIIGGILFLGCQYFEWTHLIHEGMTMKTHGEVSEVVNFGNFFYTITGFHGFHVLLGVALNVYLLVATILGVFERRGHYEMVEKIGLYWHFVDLIWVFVFLCYYLL